MHPARAAALNLIPLGLGYLCLDQHRRFAVTFIVALLLAAVGVVIVSVFTFLATSDNFCARMDLVICAELTRTGQVVAIVLFLAPYFPVSLYTACDAWKLAELDSSVKAESDRAES